MKKLILILAAAWTLTGCGLLANINWNEEQIASAVGKAATAASISDEQIAQLCAQSIAELDRQSTIDNGAYLTRLSKLMSGVTVQGLTLNLKVYRTSEINAFASGDGSIRVYSGLMDVMTDDELMAIIGHEIGHVVHQDTKNAMKKAYMASAAADLIGAAGNVGALAQGMAGQLAEAYVNAQFSQKQEYAADDFGFEFAIQTGHSPYSMCNALEKLVNLSQGSQASAVAQMFSSHPDSAKRAARIKSKAESYLTSNKK
ncbi:MAG: M48 family metalloprotease [Bacteroidia bacterium]|nr:M48 family metalloprotease [Bacteroidia bacterium]